MSVLNRIKSIFKAKANTILNEVENPEEALNLSIYELKEKMKEIKKALLDVTTIKKKLERDLLNIVDKIKISNEQAELAIKAEREDLALAALEKKQNLVTQQEKLKLEIDKLDQKIKVISQNKKQLERRINELEIKKRELIAINKAADAQIIVSEIISGISDDITEITERIERAENKIIEKTAKINAIEELVENDSLNDFNKIDKIDKELTEIQRKNKVKEELEALKTKMETEES